MHDGMSAEQYKEIEAKENEIFKNYMDVVQVLIMAIEVRRGIFPAYIYTELRSLFTHFSRFRLADTLEDKLHHLNGASRHLGRMTRDLHKDLCFTIAEENKNYINKFAKAILLVGPHGDLNKRLAQQEKKARNLYFDAKILDSKGTLTDNEEVRLFDAFQTAYAAYSELDNLIEENKSDIIEKDAQLESFRKEELDEQVNAINEATSKTTRRWALITIGVAIAFFFLGLFAPSILFG